MPRNESAVLKVKAKKAKKKAPRKTRQVPAEKKP